MERGYTLIATNSGKFHLEPSQEQVEAKSRATDGGPYRQTLFAACNRIVGSWGMSPLLIEPAFKIQATERPQTCCDGCKRNLAKREAEAYGLGQKRKDEVSSGK